MASAKRLRTASSDGPSNVFFVLIKRTSGDFKTVSPFLINKFLNGVVSELKAIRKIKDGLLVECKSEEQCKKLLALKKVAEFDVTVSLHEKLNSSKGMVYCPDLMNCTEAEILEELKEQKVIHVRRIMSKKNGILCNTPSLVLTFSTCLLPQYIYAAMYRLPVKLYIPNPLRCFKCQKYGHSSGGCNEPQVCVCGQSPHTSVPCSKIECVNCKQNHAANSKQCPVFLYEFAVQKYKLEHKCSFAEARQNVPKTGPTVMQKSFANVTASSAPPAPSFNVNDIAAVLLPQIKKMVENLFSHFVNTFTQQTQLLFNVLPSASTNATTTFSAPTTSSAAKASSATTKSSAANNFPVPFGPRVILPGFDSNEESDCSVQSQESLPNTSTTTGRKKDRRGWVKGRSRSKT